MAFSVIDVDWNIEMKRAFHRAKSWKLSAQKRESVLRSYQCLKREQFYNIYKSNYK